MSLVCAGRECKFGWLPEGRRRRDVYVRESLDETGEHCALRRVGPPWRRLRGRPAPWQLR